MRSVLHGAIAIFAEVFSVKENPANLETLTRKMTSRYCATANRALNNLAFWLLNCGKKVTNLTLEIGGLMNTNYGSFLGMHLLLVGILGFHGGVGFCFQYTGTCTHILAVLKSKSNKLFRGMSFTQMAETR